MKIEDVKKAVRKDAIWDTLISLEKELQNLIHAYELGEFTDTEYKKRREEIDKNINKIEIILKEEKIEDVDLSFDVDLDILKIKSLTEEEKMGEKTIEEYDNVKIFKHGLEVKYFVKDENPFRDKFSLLENDDDLEEIMISGGNIPIYVVHRKYGMCKTNIIPNEKEIYDLILSYGITDISSKSLFDIMLPDGSRVNVTRPTVSKDTTVTIRKFRKEPFTMIDLINNDTITPNASSFIWLCLEGLNVRRANILLAGGTSSGKTTSLNTLSSFFKIDERVITIEDTLELNFAHEHWIQLQSNKTNVMDDLVKNTLRMRPDRIIVGEVRGPEANTLFTAMNTGHDGCLCTIHANTAKEVITRLTSAPMNVPEILIGALDLIVMQNRFQGVEGSIRRVTEISEIAGYESGKVLMNKLYEWNPKTDLLDRSKTPSRFFEEISHAKGIDPSDLNEILAEREIILLWFKNKGIRDPKRLRRFINFYYEEPDTFMAYITKDVGFKEK